MYYELVFYRLQELQHLKNSIPKAKKLVSLLCAVDTKNLELVNDA
ncbi:hypothetical protein [Campylobacter pinnipediorum]|nr:hypothetical protein [Campylobacter pinnipediorum]